MDTPKLKIFQLKDLHEIPQIKSLSQDEIFNMEVVANVLPFRVNNYVIEELIDWSNIPKDPIFQLTFMNKEMLNSIHFNKMASAIKNQLPNNLVKQISDEIRMELNPHPAGQLIANVPFHENVPIGGLQHKYKETVLIFPTGGQTCHAYCSFCFRWAQFVGIDDLQFATDESEKFQDYIHQHKEISDILFTGGDPMIMKYQKLKVYIEPFLSHKFEHIQNIRIGTKSLAYWPYRFVTDNDADEILKLFERIIKSGKHLTIMAHFSHFNELKTKIVVDAINRLRNIGVEIRTQSPVIKHVNDDSEIWKRMWKEQVRLGLIPYYMFVERNTGAKKYFEVPLKQVFNIYKNAFNKLSGLSRTARGPVMSAFPGKVKIEGIADINNQKVFVLNLLQARNPDWVKRPFFAKYDSTATWYTHLTPAFGEEEFFFDRELTNFLEEKKEMYSNSLIN
ncbi:MAG: lysine 2,3-aminomutase [Ignavibacteriae bacterium]|nr:lysine 2,3-aminomutase [Ignavibacteriota bacterium]